MRVIVLCVLLFIAIPVHADLIKEFSKNTISIKDNGMTLGQFELLENSDNCLIDCYAKIRITTDRNPDMKWLFSLPLKDYKITREAVVLINKTGISCNPYQIIDAKSMNGTRTDYANCTEYTYFEQQLKEVPYEYGGFADNNKNIILYLRGKKTPAESVEWIPEFYGLKLNEFAWWNGDYTYKRQINITNLQGTSETDWTVNFTIDTYTDMGNAGKLRPDCYDISFTNDAEDTELSYHFENRLHPDIGCNTTKSNIFLKIPELNSTSFIWMYYGNPSKNTPAEDEPGTYGNDLYGVWHFGEQSGTVHNDSTGKTSGFTTLTNHPDINVSGVGEQGLSVNFSAVNQRLYTVPNPANINNIDGLIWNFSVTLWVKPFADPLDNTPHAILVGRPGGNHPWTIYITTGHGASVPKYDFHGFLMYDLSTAPETDTNITYDNSTYGKWRFIGVTVNKVADNLCIFVNGIMQNCVTNTVTGTTKYDTPLVIGNTELASPSDNANWLGGIDEIYIYNITLSVAQLMLKYNGVKIDMNPEQELIIINEYRIEYSNPTPDNNITVGFDYSLVINGTFNVSGSFLPASVWLEWNGINESSLSYEDETGHRDISHAISYGNVYTYKLWVNNSANQSNSTSMRTILVSSLTQSQVTKVEGIFNEAWQYLLLLLVVVVGLYFLFKK